MSQQPPGLPPLGGFESAPEVTHGPSSGGGADGKPPAELRRAAVIQTLIAAILVFFGVFYISQAKSLTRQLLGELSTAQGTALQDMSEAKLQQLLYVAASLLIVLGLLHGVAAQGLRSAKAWARPVGYTAGGILIAFTLIGFIGGAISVPIILLGLLSVWAVVLLSRPIVRSYLSSKKK